MSTQAATRPSVKGLSYRDAQLLQATQREIEIRVTRILSAPFPFSVNRSGGVRAMGKRSNVDVAEFAAGRYKKSQLQCGTGYMIPLNHGFTLVAAEEYLRFLQFRPGPWDALLAMASLPTFKDWCVDRLVTFPQGFDILGLGSYRSISLGWEEVVCVPCLEVGESGMRLTEVDDNVEYSLTTYCFGIRT